jgi:hypothetical protein
MPTLRPIVMLTPSNVVRANDRHWTDGHGPALDDPLCLRSASQVFELCEAVQTDTGHTVELAWANQGYTGQQPR